EAAGCDAGEEAEVGRKAEQFAQAKTGIKVIARARCDFWLRRKWAFDEAAPIRPACECVRGGMNDQGIHFHQRVDFLAKLQKVVWRRFSNFESEIAADFVAFFFIQSEYDVEVCLKGSD